VTRRAPRPPISALALLQQEMGEIVHRLSVLDRADRLPGSEWSPAVDVFEARDRLVVVIEVAGLAPESLRVVFRERELVLAGERRARRTGNVFYGCSRYPRCDFTTNLEPLGAVHDADAGAVALKDESGMCLRCGASVDLPGDRADLPGRTLPGGPPNPAALVPSRKRRAASRGGSGSRTTGRAAKGRGSAAASSDAA